MILSAYVQVLKDRGTKNPRNVGLAPSRPDERWTHPATDGLLVKLCRP
jgi:hypothetical protein